MTVVTSGANKGLRIDFGNVDLDNGTKYCLVLCQPIPVGTGTAVVEFVANNQIIPGLNGIGNKLRADQIKCRTKYSAIYGLDTPHFIIKSCLPESFYTKDLDPTCGVEAVSVSAKSKS